jgi:hypothetical protein
MADVRNLYFYLELQLTYFI